MRILGLDPGTATTGYGMIDVLEGNLVSVTYGVIVTPAKEQDGKRLRLIYDRLWGLLQEYQPELAAIEQLFFGKNVTTAITVGQARGVLLLALENAGIPTAEYTPAKVKETIVGYGNAEKAQMQLMVRHLLNLDEIPHPDDAADGLALALTHYYHQRHQALIN